VQPQSHRSRHLVRSEIIRNATNSIGPKPSARGKAESRQFISPVTIKATAGVPEVGGGSGLFI
jgi:hypothetical protein